MDWRINSLTLRGTKARAEKKYLPKTPQTLEDPTKKRQPRKCQ